MVIIIIHIYMLYAQVGRGLPSSERLSIAACKLDGFCVVYGQRCYRGSRIEMEVYSCISYSGPLGPSWAHVGGYVGPSWGLYLRILDRKMAQNNHQLKAYQKWPKNALASGLRSASGSPGQPKNGPFLATSKTSVVDSPTCLKNAAEKSIQNPFRAATSEKSRFLGSPWPLLGAMSARLGRPVGPSWRPRWRHFGPCCHKRQGGRLANHAPTISPAAGRAPTNAPTHGRLGNHSRRLSPVACRAHTNAAPHGWAPRKPLPGAPPSGLSRPHQRSNARANAKMLQNASFARSKT